jgi:hypothetical protein
LLRAKSTLFLGLIGPRNQESRMNFGGCTLGGTQYDKRQSQAQQADRETGREDDDCHEQDKQVAQGEVLKHDLVSLLLYRLCATFVTVGKLISCDC